MDGRSNSSASLVVFVTPKKEGQSFNLIHRKLIKVRKKHKKISYNINSGGSPNIWNAPPKVTVNVDELLQRVKAMSDYVKEKDVLFNLDEQGVGFLWLTKIKRIVKRTKDLVTTSFAGLGVKELAAIADTSYAVLDVLLVTVENAVALKK